MIVYDLVCTHGHRFEGWFASGDAFAEQRARSLVACPICNDAAIERLPSARVNVSKSAPPAPPSSTAPSPSPAAAGLPAEMLGKLREMVKQTENVGRRFPEEARRIHYDEAPARPIRGQASAEEAQALDDEGIAFSPVPPFLLPDTH
jgi:hypothetical protein